jgi:hypothetical protein
MLLLFLSCLSFLFLSSNYLFFIILTLTSNTQKSTIDISEERVDPKDPAYIETSDLELKNQTLDTQRNSSMVFVPFCNSEALEEVR